MRGEMKAIPRLFGSRAPANWVNDLSVGRFRRVLTAVPDYKRCLLLDLLFATSCQGDVTPPRLGSTKLSAR